MLPFIRFRMNKHFIYQSCENYIHHWESYTSYESCADVLLRNITRYMDENKDLITAQRDTDVDFRFFIFKLLAKVTYDMCASRVFYGRKISNIEHIHTKAMEELLYLKCISQKEFDEDAASLKNNVAERRYI